MFFSINDTFKWAIAAGDQVIFTYEKSDGKLATRYVTPLKFEKQDTQVLCRQHLPKDDFRCFNISQIRDVRRVITRAEM